MDDGTSAAASLLAVVSDLEPPLQQALSSTIIDELPDGAFEILLDFALMVPASAAQLSNLGDLPPTVSQSGWERWRPIRRRLVAHPSIDDQIHEVHNAAIVGFLDAALLETAGRPRRWIVKTHAGTDEERLAWLRALPSLRG